MWFAFLAMAQATPPVDVTGEWLIIGDHEAIQGPVPVVKCHGRRATWRFAAEGDGVTATYVAGHHTSGALRPTRTTVSGELSGGWRAGSLHLKGEETWRTVSRSSVNAVASRVERHPRTFSLALERDHLVGTLNGAPVRLAPADLQTKPEDCGPPPP